MTVTIDNAPPIDHQASPLRQTGNRAFCPAEEYRSRWGARASNPLEGALASSVGSTPASSASPIGNGPRLGAASDAGQARRFAAGVRRRTERSKTYGVKVPGSVLAVRWTRGKSRCARHGSCLEKIFYVWSPS